jgi:ABC-type multidrug transport system fused ATPase/permease subunit
MRTIPGFVSRFKGNMRVHFGREDWKFLLPYLKSRVRSIAFASIGLVLVSHANLINLWVVATLIGKVIPSGDLSKVAWLGSLFLMSRIILSLLGLFIHRQLTGSVGSLVNDIRRDVLGSILKGYDLANARRDLRMTQSRVVNDTRHLQDSITAMVGQTLPTVILVCTTLFIIGRINPGLLMILLVIIPFFLFFIRVRGGFLYRRIQAMNEAANRYEAHVSLVFHFLEHIRLRMSDAWELDAHGGKLRELRQTQVDLSMGQSMYQLANTIFHSLLFLAVLFFGSTAVMQGGMGIDRLVVLFFSINLLYSHSSTLLNGYTKLLDMGEALQALRALSREGAQAPRWEGRTPMPAEGPLSFRNVSFGYPGREVLQDVDFDIAHRGCVALVGNNGAGKTTLVQLLLGLLRPSSGSIRYGDVQLDDIDMLAYRKSIGYVPQRPRLMPGTVRSNLAYGMGDVSDDRLYEALRLSMAEELVGRLPDGLDTPLGEEGTRLSGGERQRLAIAAAILAHPRILVLDEPTNHLDAEAIRQLIANIKGLPDSPTILFVSHNSEMLSMADRILYLSQGRLQDLAREAYLELAPLAGESPPGKSSG